MDIRKTVKVSVLMGVYNPVEKRQFYQAVCSVLCQSFHDWELILYDDGSCLRDAQMMQRAAGMDRRIRYVRGSRNRGLAYAMNRCISLARGEYVARMDADDICKPERLEKQAAFLDEHPEFAWVGSNAELMDEKGVWGYRKMPEIPEKRDFLYNLPYIHPTVMFRRAALAENGGYCTAKGVLQCEDYELFMRLHSRGLRGYNIQEALFQYREDFASMRKRTYRRRIREMHVRRSGFEALGMKGRHTFFYIWKPLIVGAVPAPVHHYIKKMKKKSGIPQIKKAASGKTGKRKQYERYLKKSPELYAVAQRISSGSGGTAKETAVFALAPALACYVLWVLEEAVRSKKQRLYFLARDGYLMYRMAVIFCKRLHVPVECRYVSCSRYALRIPAYHLNEQEALSYICRGGIAVTPDKILYRAGLDREQAQEIKKRLGGIWTEDAKIPYGRLGTARKELEHCPEFMQMMRMRSEEAFPRLAAYLKQEGFLDEVNDAVVDSGWVGSIQKTLNEVLGRLGRRTELEGYYWGLYEIPQGSERKAYHCYAFSPERSLNRKVFFNNCVFEAVFSAPHGMTTGYRTEDGKRTAPQYAKINDSLRRFYGNLAHITDAYAKALSEELLQTSARQRKVPAKRGVQTAGMNVQTRYGAESFTLPFETKREIRERWSDTAAGLLRTFMTNPTKEEVRYFGRLPFSDDVLTGKERPLAERLTQKELWQNHPLPRILAMGCNVRGLCALVKESAWYEGSAVRAGKWTWYHLWQYTGYQYLRYIRKMYSSTTSPK